MCDVVLDFEALHASLDWMLKLGISEPSEVYVGATTRTVHSNVKKVAIRRGLQPMVGSGQAKRRWPEFTRYSKKTVTCLSSKTHWKGKTWSNWRSAWISRRPFQRNPHDFRTNASRKNERQRD